MIVKLTEALIRSAVPLPGKAKTEFVCDQGSGLFLEVRRTSPGRGTWYVRYKIGSATKYSRIGDSDSISLPEARAKAKGLRAQIQLGADPSEAARKQKEVPTFKAFVEEQYLPYIKARKRSYRDDENRLRQHLIPAFGNQRLNTVTRKQLVELHLSLKEDYGLAGATCDHFIKLVRAVYNVAIQWEVVTENPAARIPLFREPNQVENYMTEEQLQRLLVVLHSSENRNVARIAMFLLSCGARLNEALTATWEQIDMDSSTWRIPASTSKSKKVRAVPLNASAIDVLDEIQPDLKLRKGFLFLNDRTGTNLKTVHRAWYKIREEAGVPFLRLHDLRHMYASFLVNSGRSLYEVQQVLGHSSPIVTQRYAHLTTRTLQDASDTASARIRAASPKRPLPALKLVSSGS